MIGKKITMNNKKILMISYHTCPLSAQEGKEIGGMNIYVLELAKELVKKGYQVDVFTRDQDKTSKKIVEVMPGFRVIHIIAGPEQSVSKKELAPFIPDFVKHMKEFIAQEHLSYDILHCHYYLSGIAGLQLQQTVSFKQLIMTFHTLALMKNLVARDESEIENQERIEAELELVQKADVIISPSEADAEYLKYLYACPPKKIAIIPPGVDTTLYRPIRKEEAKHHIKATIEDRLILFVGRIEPLKGIDVLMYAIKILHEKNPELRICLWIVGGDISLQKELWSEELKKLEEIRTMLGLETTVKFVGRKDPKELPYYYNAAELVVMPSQYESFGMTALESMACGTPVITTNATGISDFLDTKHEALITSANNPLLLATQIEFLLTNPTDRMNLGTDVYKKVQDLSWERIAEFVSMIYG